MTLKGSWREFRRDVPGRRFARRYQRLNGRDRHPFGRVLRVVVGAVLVALGFVFGFLPGPGFVPAFIGLALLAGESRRIAAWLDRAEVKVRRRLG